MSCSLSHGPTMQSSFIACSLLLYVTCIAGHPTQTFSSNNGSVHNIHIKKKTEETLNRLLFQLGITEIPQPDCSRRTYQSPQIRALTEAELMRRCGNLTSPTPPKTTRPTSPPRVIPPLNTPRQVRVFSEECNLAECGVKSLQFRLDNDTISFSHVTQATFRVRVRCRKSKGNTSRHSKRSANRVLNINLYQINGAASNETRTLVSAHRVTVRKTKWEDMLVPTTLVQEVLASRDKTLRLLIECDGCDRRVRLVMHHRSRSRGRRSREENRPHLLLETAPQGNYLYTSRHRRHAVTTSECCRTEEVDINFSEFGLTSFIISPTHFSDKVCISACTGVCCEPVQRSSLSVIYVDNDDQVKMRVLQNFITESCGCPN